MKRFFSVILALTMLTTVNADLILEETAEEKMQERGGEESGKIKLGPVEKGYLRSAAFA